MCFKIESNVKYATKPIKVYKRLCLKDGKYISPFIGYEWKIGKLEKANLSFTRGLRIVAEKDKKHLGINQVYSPLYFAFINKDIVLVKEVINYNLISEGLHSYINEKEMRLHLMGDVLVECEIPKHSWYYINKDFGECVSDQLIIKKIL